MTTAAQVRRASWLRRTRRVTAWIAALATATTLLIAAVAGSAAPPTRMIRLVRIPPRSRPASLRRVTVPVREHHRRIPRRQSGRIVKAVAETPAKVRATKSPPPAPAPAPAATPVVVSGGS